MITPTLQTRLTTLAGCIELLPQRLEDERGRFLKVFNRDAFSALSMPVEFAEVYYSVSKRGVIRGLHFQTPPAEHAKLVYCTAGKVQDAVVDLRVGSPTFGHCAVLELSAAEANMLFIPPGIAHGFGVLSETATMVYHVTSQYSKEHDEGILWSSAGIPWSIESPVLSPRDRIHPAMESFSSPFRFHSEGFVP